MRRLIRDKIAANMLQEGNHKVYALDTDWEYGIALAEYLDELKKGLLAERFSDKRLYIAAEIVEVLTSIVGLDGYKPAKLIGTRHEQERRCGGFENRYVIETEK
jgi:predicted house-cleaning noncanonical NTP pyrophosphatase (MazG superfamily)